MNMDEDLFEWADRVPQSRITRHIDNVPDEVKDLFEKLTFRLIGLGITKYSARAILHQIRWHKHVDEQEGSFKCNDHWTPYLARWFAEKHPLHKEFFEYRKLACDNENYEFFQ